jgi:HSP20 family protein
MTQPARRGGGTLTRYDPFAEFNRLTQQLTQLVDDRWPDTPSLLGRDGFSPPADVEETDDAYLIELDLPGVDKKDIDVEATGRRLVVQGERKEKERTGMLRRQTRTVGRFRYEVVLPDQVDGDSVEATLEGGVLRLRVPKAKTADRRRIEVK